MSNAHEVPARRLADSLRSARRKPLRLSEPDLVTIEEPANGATLPLVLRPAVDGVDPIAWTSSQRSWLTERLHRYGGLLLRGFAVRTPADFEALIRAHSGDPLAYLERSSPRTEVSAKIYTSTDYPAHQAIFPHCENSYQHTWPMKISFFCSIAPASGGETPIADCRRVLRRLSPDLVARFEQRGVKYIRNYGERLGLSWQDVFQTSDRAAVDAYCRTAGLVPTWKPDGALRTERIAPAIRVHPVTGEATWFNHAAFFHVATLPDGVREALLADYGPDELPNQTCYGDGTPIDSGEIEEIRRAYMEELVTFSWQVGDVLLLDNMLTAHARNPFEGPRRILVGMGEAYAAS